MNTIQIVLSPDLLNAYSDATMTCVVIDVLRASTTMITALHNGASAIYPLDSLEQAEAFAKEGKLVGAERNVKRCHFAKFGNDPMQYTTEAIGGEEVYFTTTNGTKTIEACMHLGHEVLVGSFVNLKAVAEACEEKNILAVCAGWRGQICCEDALFAAALAYELQNSHKLKGDATKMMALMWKEVKEQLHTYLKETEHYQRLRQHGLQDTLNLCLKKSIYSTVPKASLTETGATILLPFTKD